MKPIYYAVMSLPKSVLTLCLAVWMGCALAPMLLAQGYTMMPIARPNDPTPDGRRFYSASFPSLNDQSQVAFVGCIARYECGLYFYDQSQITRIAHRDDVTDRCGTLALFGPRPSLNNWGQIAFPGGLTRPGADGIFLFDGHQLVTLVCPGDPAPDGSTFSRAYTPALNSKGQVAFFAILANGYQGIFLYDGTEIRPVVRSGDPAPEGGWFERMSDPWLNDQGQIMFTGYVSQPGRSGVFLFERGEIRKVVQALDPAPDGGVFGGIYYAALNALGQVVFNAEVRNPTRVSRGMFLFNGRDIRRITPGRDPDTGDEIRDFFDRPVINRFGHVAFAGSRRSRQGLFLFDGERFITVGLSGDPRPDEGVFSGFALLSLNSLEQVAFVDLYPLPDAEGVFLAIPDAP